ncbi:hypothetical protein ACIRBX_19755 [Kitasatospora sp. NPDC096147]|uniref:hypothetical protein n=1 Tax=Kitasatospora sp. NPDC096147 TaxID=3364093 RepID=UPI0038207388
MRRLTGLALTALLLAGCGTATGGHPSTTGGQSNATGGHRSTVGTLPAPTVAAELRERAAQVAREWPGSEAERAWSTGYHPLAADLEWLPSDAFTKGGKVAYLSGLFEPVVALPTADATAEVVWVYGQRAALPMLSPTEVLARLAEGKHPCGPACEPPLKVTGAARGSRTVATSRGQATVPVWEFTVEGYQEPFAFPAVAPQQPPAGTPSGKWERQGVGFLAVSADGLTVTGEVRRGGCEEVVGTEAYETDRVVVLMAQLEPLRTTASCDAALLREPVAVRLTRPLDARLVLDLATGAPRPAH